MTTVNVVAVVEVPVVTVVVLAVMVVALSVVPLTCFYGTTNSKRQICITNAPVPFITYNNRDMCEWSSKEGETTV